METWGLIPADNRVQALNEALQRLKVGMPRPHILGSYGVTVLSVGAALGTSLWMQSELGRPATPIVALFLCAVMWSSWCGGIRSWLLAVTLSLLAMAYFFAPPINSLAVDSLEVPRMVVFGVSALFVGGLSAAQRRRAETLRCAYGILNEAVQDLNRSNRALRAENAERCRAEAQLHEKQQEFRAIVENAPDLIIRYDRDFRRLYVNPAVARYYGLPAEALIGEVLGSGIPGFELEFKGDEVAQVRERIAQVFATGEVSDHELALTMPGGRTYFSIRWFPEFALDGSVLHVLGIWRDITEHKIAEGDLKKEKEILEKIFTNIPLMIGFVDTDGGVKLVNPEWERTMGWTLEELHDEKIDIFAEAFPEIQYRQEVLKFFAAATGEPADLKIRVRDGRTIYSACTVVRLSDGTKIAIAQDITNRKEAEERLQSNSEQLRALSARLQSAKEEEDIRIAREIHDEMGASLTGLRWELERLGKTISNPDEWAQRGELNARIDDMIGLTDSAIGTMRRIASELRPSILDDLGLVEALEWQCQQFQARTGITCSCSSSVENVEFDPAQSTAVFRIFQEALTNITRHSGATQVDAVTQQEDEDFLLTITDNGRGITEEQTSGGLSLGILGMRERAHLIAGEIEITGSADRGTVVSLRVPLSC